MALNLASFIPNLFAFLFFLFLAVFFIYQSRIQDRPVKYVLISMIFGAITSLMILIWSTLDNRDSEIAWIIRNGYLFMSALQFLYFYFFIENIISLKPKRWNLIGVSLLLGLAFVGFLASNIFYRQDSTENLEIIKFFRLIGRIGYNGLAVFIFVVLSIPIYYKMYRYTKEFKSTILFTAVCLIAFGYILTLIFDIIYIYRIDLFTAGSFCQIMLDVGNNVPMAGLGIFAIVYAFNISYIYRLPSDHYVLQVAYKNGLNLLSVRFETKHRTVQVMDQLFSGMISAINTVYTTMFNIEHSIEAIMSEELSIVMESGDQVTVIVVTEQPSGVLKRGMKLFVKKFEHTFQEALARSEQDLLYFENGKQIFTRIFPFLKVVN